MNPLTLLVDGDFPTMRTQRLSIVWLVFGGRDVGEKREGGTSCLMLNSLWLLEIMNLFVDGSVPHNCSLIRNGDLCISQWMYGYKWVRLLIGEILCEYV
ncbi:hypothetical protein VNO77_33135 [Canavalia gladiata]|uniref:Uncharacterized protein n=1 Tax=Canavalia gladiata TaxID=3824 RepID=A0AAN9KE53_CANGL